MTEQMTVTYDEMCCIYGGYTRVFALKTALFYVKI